MKTQKKTKNEKTECLLVRICSQVNQSDDKTRKNNSCQKLFDKTMYIDVSCFFNLKGVKNVNKKR
jgi:hypothetical protein